MTRALLPALVALSLTAPSAAQTVYEQDMEFALEALEEKCGHFFEQKDIDWKKVSKEFREAAEEVEDDQQHLMLLTRLLARVRDGHARVEKRDATDGVAWPEDGPFGTAVERGGTGLALCRDGKKVYVKSVAGPAEDARILPGSEVLKIDGEKAGDWLEQRVATWGDVVSWSTPQQADAWARHWGMSAEAGGRMKVELKEPGGKKKARTVTVGSRSVRMAGPAVWPEGLQTEGNVSWTTLEDGWGYIYLRRCRSEVLEQMDAALAALGEAPGLILDFRGNGGGGFDHDALLGRFVPAGQELAFVKRIASAGPRQYGGPVVVLVDATTVSAGETGSGMFKEEGRALMLGPTPTAGMSSSKETLELPSGKFALYVSVHSNKSRWQGGRGIEGVGVEPHEIVPYDPDDLAGGVDTLIRVACERLDKGKWKDVPYDPEDFDWEAP